MDPDTVDRDWSLVEMDALEVRLYAPPIKPPPPPIKPQFELVRTVISLPPPRVSLKRWFGELFSQSDTKRQLKVVRTTVEWSPSGR